VDDRGLESLEGVLDEDLTDADVNIGVTVPTKHVPPRG